MTALFFALLQVSALVGGLSLLLWCLRGFLRRYPAKWRRALLLLLCLRLLVPFRLTLPQAPVQVTVPAEAGETILWTAPAPAPEGIVLPGPVTPVLPSAPAETVPVAPQTPAAPEAAAPRRSIRLADALMLLWAVGAVCALLWQVGGSLLFRRRAARWAVPADGETEALARTLAARVGVPCPPVLITPALRAPVAAGLLRPVLLLPEGQEGLSFVLAHELCHLRRRDLWGKLLAALAGALHWFNPLVWLLTRQLGESMECACDEEVLALLGPDQSRAYSETILRAARGGGPALTTGFSGGLKARLRNIFAPKRRHGAVVCALLALCALTAGTLVACDAARPAAPDDEPPAVADPAVPAPEPLSALELYDLALEYRVDLLPLFDEGQAPSAAADYVIYAFFAFPDRPERWSGANGNGYVSKEFLDQVAAERFGVTELTYASLGREWNYDGAGWTAAPMGGPEQRVCFPLYRAAETVDGRTVYTVDLRLGDDGRGPADDEDFAAARAAAEAGEDYPMVNYAVWRLRFELLDGAPRFLSMTYTGDLSPAGFFDLALAEGFDRAPYFAEGEARPDGAVAARWPAARSLVSDLVDGQVVHTVTADLYAPTGDRAAFRAGLASGELPAAAPVGKAIFCCTQQGTETVLLWHIEVVEPPADTPELRLYDYFRDHDWQLNPFPVLRDRAMSSDAWMVFALQGMAQSGEVDWAAGVDPARLAELAGQYLEAQGPDSYETAYSTVLPDGRVTATGWSFHGAVRLVAREIRQRQSGSYAGVFEMYSLPEGMAELALADADLRAGRTEPWAQYAAGMALISWEEIADDSERGFHLRYHSCELFEDSEDILWYLRPRAPLSAQLAAYGGEVDGTPRDFAAWYEAMTPLEDTAEPLEWAAAEGPVTQDGGRLRAEGDFQVSTRTEDGAEVSAQLKEGQLTLTRGDAVYTDYIDDFRGLAVARLWDGMEYLLAWDNGLSDDPVVHLWRLDGGMTDLGELGGENPRFDAEGHIVCWQYWLDADPLPILTWYRLDETLHNVWADPALFEGTWVTLQSEQYCWAAPAGTDVFDGPWGQYPVDRFRIVRIFDTYLWRIELEDGAQFDVQLWNGP